MKRCPQCRRDYYDDTLLFCLDDGTELVEGPASVDEPATAILNTAEAHGETATRAQIHTTEQTAVLPSISVDASGQKKNSFFKRVLLALLAVLIAGAGVFIGYRYFGASSRQIESLAVLPFVNESGNPDIDYLSDGMTETLINSLSQIPNLSVKARSSVFRYKGKEIDPKKVAAELGVQAILTGRVVQRGEQMKLSLELIDETENVIWGQNYERKASDLLALQTEVARDVSGKLKSRISGDVEERVAKKYTSDPEAYQFYLKGRYQWNRRTSDSLKQATQFYKQAIEKDPNYALAYAALAETYVLFSAYFVTAPTDSMPQAKAMALKALELDDSLAEAHAALGEYLSLYEWDRAGAEAEFHRAIELNPNYATAHHWLGGDLLIPLKRFDEGIAELKRAEELDPLSLIIQTNLGDALLFSRRYDEAVAQYKRVLSLDPNFQFARFQLATAYQQKGMHGEAIEEYRKGLELGYDPLVNGSLAYSLARLGRTDEARKILEQLRRESAERYVPAYAIVLPLLGLGEKEEVLKWLEKDVEERSTLATYYSASPELDGLRSEPRFKALLKKLNLPE